MSYTLDTFAWIEYFEGSRAGYGVRKIIEEDYESLITPSVVLAELADSIVRGKVHVAWQDVAKFIFLNTDIKDIDAETAEIAGKIKNNLRKKHPDFGLIDAIVLATSIKNDSKLLTGDNHLVGEKDVIDIRKADFFGSQKGL